MYWSVLATYQSVLLELYQLNTPHTNMRKTNSSLPVLGSFALRSTLILSLLPFSLSLLPLLFLSLLPTLHHSSLHTPSILPPYSLPFPPPYLPPLPPPLPSPPSFLSSVSANRVSDKLTQISDRIFCSRSGSSADTQATADLVKKHLNLHRYMYCSHLLASFPGPGARLTFTGTCTVVIS